MLKVFLVEDEIVVREGIKNNINWEDNGFIFCGEASDGELAYPMIQKMKPDIVVTDIRMPFMDGLELSRLIKKEMPGIKIIILSGYGEFEYAKEAINIGVTEYLLKPISGADLVKSLKSVGELIRKEQEEKENLEKFRREMKEYEADEKRRLFHDLVNGNQPLSGLLARGKELNLELSAMAYNIVLFTMDMPRQSLVEPQILLEAEQELEILLEGREEILKFNFFMEGIAILIKGSSFEEIRMTQDTYINRIKEIMNRRKQISYFGGIGVPVRRLGELPVSFREASRAFAYRYIWDVNEILDSSTITEGAMNLNQTGIDMGNVMQRNKKKVEDFLKSGSGEDVPYFVEEYLKSLGNDTINSTLFRQYMVMDMYYIVTGFLEELGYGSENTEKPFQDKAQGNRLILSYEAAKDYIGKIFSHAVELRDVITTRHYSDMINKAKEYINENYHREELSLNMAAASVYISPSHFSAVFSQRTGQTFIKYLTDLRMRKAKELLKCTDMRAADIGYKVGYKDPHYFSYLFKKTQNCTPKQYRFSNQQREEYNA
jgi:two-component system response regulator YesN